MSLSIAGLLISCAALGAQGLPKLPQLEMEEFRLALLDAKNQPEGSLEGRLARSKRDGTIEIDGAVLTLQRGAGKLVARAEKFVYTPGADTFDCPSGMEADLPDGGKLSAPAAKGTLTRSTENRREVVLKFSCTGMLTVRGGQGEKSALRGAEIADPEVEVRLVDPDAAASSTEPGAKPKAEKAVLAMSVKGKRGGSAQVVVRKAPDMVPAAAPGAKEDQPPMLLLLSCFGDIEVDLDPRNDAGNFSLQRRARLALGAEPPADKRAGPLEITANLLRVRGKIVETANRDGKKEQALSDMEIDGVDTVHVSGPQFVGFGDQFEYRQVGRRHDTRLTRGPTADILLTPNETDESERAFLRMKARDAISISSESAAGPDAAPAPVTARLQSGAQVWREVGGAVEFHLVGSEIEMTTRALKETTPPDDKGKQKEYLHWVVDAFRVISEGYSPILRIAGTSGTGGVNLDAGQRAAVFGSRAEGSVDALGMLHARAYGPEILAVLFAEYGLADEIRYALNLRKRPEDLDPPRERQPRPGRMEVRAMATLDLDITTLAVSLGEPPKPLGLNAVGDVRLEHTPLPRDDRDLLTLSGENLQLVLGGLHVNEPDVPKGQKLPAKGVYQNPRLERAALLPSPGAECLATLGFDLLISRGFRFDAQEGPGQQQLAGLVTGPGRMVIRDGDSLAYFSRLVQRLPRRAEIPARQVPDAGWMDFRGDITVHADQDTRRLDAAQARFELVFGEFEGPRAGQSALKDLAELVEPEVQPLYLAQGRRLLLVSSGHAPDEVDKSKPRALVNLLRLEGDALLRDFTEGLEASAVESIEATGSDDQRSPGNPLAVVLLGSPRVVMRQAGDFFGEVVTRGAFAYDGRWALTAGERLELTFRPLSIGDHESLKVIRGDLQALQLPHEVALTYVIRASRAVRMMRDLAALLPAEDTPETQQALEALRCTEAAGVMAGQCQVRESTGARDAILRARMARNARRAHDLLAGLIDLAAMGGVQGEFSALDEITPSLKIEMHRIIMSFNGLGEIVQTRGEGPVKVSRADYTITGATLSRSRDGALVLDGAAINLPENTGVKISGVKAISLRSAPGLDGGPDVPVTRVSGKGLKVSVDLSKSAP